MRVLAPITGVTLPLSQVPDPVFSQKLAGDGLALEPTEGLLLAPCDARVDFIHPAGHALTLKTSDGAEILIHIGLETVQLRGQGFRPQVKAGQTVKLGDMLIEFDLAWLTVHAKSLMTLVLVTNPTDFAWTVPQADFMVAGRDELFSLQPLKTQSQTAVLRSQAERKSSMITCLNASGLHARPAAALASAAQKFNSEIFLHKGDQHANAKSLTAILGLQVAYQSRISLSARGADAEAAIAQIEKLLQAGLGETGAETQTATQPTAARPLDNRYTGISASPGLVMGQIYQLNSDEILVPNATGQGPGIESKRLQDALQSVTTQIQDRLKAKTDSETAQSVFQAHLQLLADPDLTDKAQHEINLGQTAEWAWSQAFQSTADVLKRLDNEVLAERSQDVKDVGQRVLRILLGRPEEKTTLPADAIIVARVLTPSQFAQLQEQKILGLVTVEGGPSSHVGILARSAGLPMLTGVHEAVLQTKNGLPVVLDGDQGLFDVNPSSDLIAKTNQKRAQWQEQQVQNFKKAHEPAITEDGFHMEVFANIGNAKEAHSALSMGAEGVGLLRSEFLFLKRQTAPTEREQEKIYSEILSALRDTKDARPVIIRTLDVGGDKPLAYLTMPPEENPFLGVRGLRLSLAHPEIFRTQLRAILNSSLQKQVRIMFPMVTSVDEFLAAKKILEEERVRIGAAPVPVGIMVEVPSAALLAENFAPHVDFFSIGSNDLTQYTLAIDRGHRDLAKQADGLHPAVLRLIGQTALAGQKYQKTVGVCGGIASDREAIPLLLGLGVTELSVSVPSIPDIKATVRSLRKTSCQELAQQALKLNSAEEVRKMVKGLFP